MTASPGTRHQSRLGLAASLPLGLIGGLATGAVVLGGQPPAERADSSPVRWPVADVHALSDTVRRLGPVLAWVGAGLLVLLWLLIVVLAARGRLPSRSVLGLATTWAAPLAAGPPVLSADVYNYLAQGEMLRRGLNPYQAGVAALGSTPVVAAVDPRWQDVPSPYGPLGLSLARLAAELGSGSLVAAVVVLRVVAVLGVAAAVYCCARLARARDRPVVLAIVAANPIVLLHLIGGVHLDAAMVGLVLGGLLLTARGRPLAGIALATAAASIKVPAGIVVAVLLVVLARTPGRPRGRPARRLLLGLGVGAGTALGCAALVPDGFGWLRTLSTPGTGRTESAPTSLLAGALSGLFGLPPAGTLVACRLLGLVVAGGAVLALLVTAGRRDPTLSAGFGQLIAALLGPVTYVWYLASPLACLAPRIHPRGRAGLVGLCALASLTSLPSLSTPAFPWPPPPGAPGAAGPPRSASIATSSGSSRQPAIPGTAMPESLTRPPSTAATAAAASPSISPGTAATTRRCSARLPRTPATPISTAATSSTLNGLWSSECPAALR